jgi:hypothetical protein
MFVRTDALWAAARTKARAEKCAAAYLLEHGVPHFLPLVARRRVYGARVRESDIPLFPGYVFFDSAAVEKELVFASRKVAQILLPPDQAQLRLELSDLAAAMNFDNTLREVTFGQPGTPVCVARGKLKGLAGTLVRYAGHSRLIIQVSFLGKAAELAIDEAFVEQVR